jgi:ubiquinone/menaquinone biosynthesis C-methylase UbiE
MDNYNSTERFSDRATAYASNRPGYPDEAVDAIFAGLGDPRTLTVADIGAGTGISSRLLAARGASVIAVEPNAKMREAAAPYERVHWQEGTAEHTGLFGDSVDIAVACQAFHWFANDAAMTEFHRIARARAAMLQYERDERHPFTKAYGDIMRAYATDDTETLRFNALGVFERFPNARVTRTHAYSRQRLDEAGFLGRAASSSYAPNEGQRAEGFRNELRALFSKYQETGFIEVALVTNALTADFL